MAVPELAPLEVKRQLDAGEPLRILDVREPWERAIVSLPGSLNIPMGEIPAPSGPRAWRMLSMIGSSRSRTSDSFVGK